MGKCAIHLKPKDGYFDVVCHGANDYIQVFGESIDAETLAAILIERSDYKPGTPIRLVSCNTGETDDGVAEFLSKKLRVPVLAPTTPVTVYSISGEAVPETVKGADDGDWKIFMPNKYHVASGEEK